jgi:pimeloyl-ACP methyl ester carboxylesterase
MERSTREPDSELTVEVHADDYHRVVDAAGLGRVDAFGSSGGGMCALPWVVAHPDDVGTLVSHEPPLTALLEDREMAIKVSADIVDTYQRAGFGPAMAKFIQLVMHHGPLPDDYLDRPAPDPAQFGFPTEDDGSRDDLLLSGNLAMPPFVPDADALNASPVRLIPAIGRMVEVHADLERVYVRAGERLVADHTRIWARGTAVTDPEHVQIAAWLRQQFQARRPAVASNDDLSRDLVDYDRVRPGRRRSRRRDQLMAAANNSASEAASCLSASVSERTAMVSSMASRSSTDISTATGRP